MNNNIFANMENRINESIKGDYWVVAIDKSLSKWGNAEGGRSAVLIHCDDDEQAYECERALGYDNEMKYIKTCYGKKPSIRNVAHIQEMEFMKCPRWNKDYKFRYNISESQLKNIITESIKKILQRDNNENWITKADNDDLERLVKMRDFRIACKKTFGVMPEKLSRLQLLQVKKNYYDGLINR